MPICRGVAGGRVAREGRGDCRGAADEGVCVRGSVAEWRASACVSGVAGEGGSCRGARAYVPGDVVEWRVRGRGEECRGVECACVHVVASVAECCDLWG